MVEQGEIIKIEGIKIPALVVSKNLFNESGKVIVCPVIEGSSSATLSFPIDDDRYVLCDSIRQLDIKSRGFTQNGRIPLAQVIQITDRIQSIFDYI